MAHRLRQHFDRNVQAYSYKFLYSYKEICERRLDRLQALLDPARALRVLDVGCGAGFFSDLVLTRFPKATVYCVDFSLPMLLSNRPSTNKFCIAGDCTRLPFRPGFFDLVNIDTVMHHLVSAKGYAQTIQGMVEFLMQSTQMVRPGGLIAIREIYHESRLIETFHTRLIYEMTIRHMPEPIAAIARRAGISTMNVGVCFLSRSQWQDIFSLLKPAALLLQAYPWKGSVIRYYRALGFRTNGDYHCYLTTGAGMEE